MQTTRILDHFGQRLATFARIVVPLPLIGVLLFAAGCSGSPDRDLASTAEQPPKLATFASPTDMVLDKRGNLYVSEMITGRIYLVSPDGTSTLFARGLDAPNGLCLDRDGNLLVAETGKARLVRIRPDGTRSIIGEQ